MTSPRLALRRPLALLLVTVLAAASALVLGVTSAQAASVAGTVTATGTNGQDFGSTLTDGEAGSTDIPGVTYSMFYGDTNDDPAGTLETWDYDLGFGPIPYSAVGGQPAGQHSFVIKSDGVAFKLSSFFVFDAYAMNANYTATAYYDGVATGATQAFTVPQSGSFSTTIPLDSGFQNVTEVRITSDGGNTPGATSLWQSFNTFVFADPVPNSNANLSALGLSAGTLAPAFAAGTTSYTASVPSATSSMTVTPTVADTGKATVTVNGVAVTSGTASGALALAVGQNTITTMVTAQDGSTTKTYTLIVTRATPPSTNATLSGLTLSSSSLTPTFAPGTTSYDASVLYTTSSLTFTPTVADATATVTVNGTSTTSGTASAPIPLVVGPNPIPVVVTAQDGTTTQTYTVTVTRTAPSADANLAGLTASAATLAPTFSPATDSYTANVGNAVTSTTITPTASNGFGTITVNGVAVTSGAASGTLPLAVGQNTITTIVTAQNGTTAKTYTLTITRAAPPSTNADLSALSLSSGTLSPGFATGTPGYTASVPNATSSLTVTPTTADATATVTVNGTPTLSGTPSTPIALAVGPTPITTIVTAQDGSTTATYTVIVTRALSPNADLAALSLSSGALSPTFAAGTTVYTASVPNATSSLTVTPTLADATASATVNGTPTTSGTASGALALVVGLNTLTIDTTAADGTPNSYTVTVTRAAPDPVVDLHLDFALGDLAADAPFVVSGSGLTPGMGATVDLHSTPVTLYTTTIGGTGAFSQSLTIPAGTEPGAHALTLTVSTGGTAVATRTVWFSILANGTIGAISFVGPVTFVPAVAGLASTGASVTAPGFEALALLLLGGTVLVAGRAWGRRRRA